MDWKEAIKKCPSNIDGVCKVMPKNTACNDNVANEKCPITQLKMREGKNNPVEG